MKHTTRTTIVAVFALAAPAMLQAGGHTYDGPYTGENLNRVAFPIGGIGAGMICLEGTGAVSHVSLRHSMQFFNEPCTFAAIHVRTADGEVAKLLEGPVPDWKVFGGGGTGNGASGSTYGLPRFDRAEFLARFPFATVTLSDEEIPLEVELTGWSPFLPGNADDSSLPVGALEYRFRNTGSETVEAVFSYHAKNFMAVRGGGDTVLPVDNGFVLWQAGTTEHPENEGGFAAFLDGDEAVVDHCWFKGGWWDAVTLAWRNVQHQARRKQPAGDRALPGRIALRPVHAAARRGAHDSPDDRVVRPAQRAAHRARAGRAGVRHRPVARHGFGAAGSHRLSRPRVWSTRSIRPATRPSARSRRPSSSFRTTTSSS